MEVLALVAPLTLTIFHPGLARLGSHSLLCEFFFEFDLLQKCHGIFLMSLLNLFEIIDGLSLFDLLQQAFGF